MPVSPAVGSKLKGRTSWKRSAALFVPGAAAVVGITMAMAQGAVAAQFGVASSNMKLSISNLDAKRVTGYVGSKREVRSGREAILLLGVAGGTAKSLCLSTVLDVPIAGQVTLGVSAGKQVPAGIDSLTANAKELLASSGVLTSAELGRDGATLDRNNLQRGPDGSWGLQAGGLQANDAHLTATNAGASQLRLQGLSITLNPGRHECF